MENVITLGKLLSLWFCFLLHSILFFDISNLFKIISSYELARPVMGTIFLVYIYRYVCERKKYLNRTLEIDSPFQTFAVGLLVEFID